MRRYAWHAAQLQSILPIRMWNTGQKAFPKCCHHGLRHSGNLTGEWGEVQKNSPTLVTQEKQKNKYIIFILGSLLGGRKVSARGLVFCPLRGRPPVIGMWNSGKPDPFQDSLLQTCYLLSSRSQICPDLRSKMGTYSTSPSIFKYSSLYFHRYTARMCHFDRLERKHWIKSIWDWTVLLSKKEKRRGGKEYFNF